MAELRWLLLLLGIGVIAAVYLFTRYKPRIAGQARSISFRKEPSIGSGNAAAEDLPTLESVTESGPVISPQSIPPEPGKVVAIRLMSRDTTGFEAERLILMLRKLGLRHGQMGIFHCMDENEDGEGAPVFSVASLLEPGSFDLTSIKTERYPGISIFLILPGPRSGVNAFDDMLVLAQELAERLDGYLLDEQGGTLSIQRERYLREEIIQFEHRELG